MSKGRVSFTALSATKRNSRGCVEVLHRARSSSRCVLEKCAGKVLGWWEVSSAEKLPKGCLSRTTAPQNYSNAIFLWTFKRFNPSCGSYLPISALVWFFLVLASLCSCFRQHRVKTRSFPAVFISLLHIIYSAAAWLKILYT